MNLAGTRLTNRGTTGRRRLPFASKSLLSACRVLPAFGRACINQSAPLRILRLQSQPSDSFAFGPCAGQDAFCGWCVIPFSTRSRPAWWAVEERFLRGHIWEKEMSGGREGTRVEVLPLCTSMTHSTSLRECVPSAGRRQGHATEGGHG